MYQQKQQQQQQKNTKAPKFFNIFPSTKIALQNSDSKRRQGGAAASSLSLTENNAGDTLGSSSVSVLPQTAPKPQHLLSQPDATMEPSVELVLQGKSSHQHVSSQKSVASDVVDILSAAGAPTEVMTNRACDRKYIMDPQDHAVWKKKKVSAVVTPLSCGDYSRDYQHAYLAEEKKQDSDVGRSQENMESSYPEMTEEELLLFGPVPLERTNTRRTSNRNGWNKTQENGEYSAAAHSAYAGRHNPTTSYLLHSSQATGPYSSPKGSQQGGNHNTPCPLNQHLRTNKTRGSPTGAYVRHSPNFQTQLDTKSLFSNSSNNSTNDESSSRLSPMTLLNPIVDNAPISVKGGDPNRLWSVENANAGTVLSCAAVQTSSNPTAASSGPSQTFKPVVAYPQSPLLSEQPQHRSRASGRIEGNKDLGRDKKEELSFGSNNTDGGVIGLVDDSDSSGIGINLRAEKNTLVRSKKALQNEAASVPKLGTSKKDDTTKSHCASNPLKTAKPPQVQLQPRMNCRASFEATGQKTDPDKSIISESSGWTPLPLSDDGLNFSSEKDTPLLPLFSQDRLDFCSRVAAPSTKLEQKLVRNNINRRAPTSDEPPAQKKSAGQVTDQHPIQNFSSPDIWRQGDIRPMNSMLSADPIFCTQPSMSQANSTMISSVALDDPINTTSLNLSSPAARITEFQVTENEALVAELQTTKKEPCGHSAGKPPPSPQRHGTEPTEPNLASESPTRGVEGIPRRSISGPALGQRRFGGSARKDDTEDECTVSSRQVEIGAHPESPEKSTSSLPRRSKSESQGILTKESTRPKGAFRAAFEAFEKASRRRGKQYSLDERENTTTSRLTLLLNVHLAKEADETADKHSDGKSVDVQSIRSTFEARNQACYGDDDDDTGSVKSLREAFEATEKQKSNTAVTKMRAMFENKRPPSARNFETGNAELKEAWSKFSDNNANKIRRNQTFRPNLPLGADGCKQVPSVADRARMFEKKKSNDVSCESDLAVCNSEAPVNVMESNGATEADEIGNLSFEEHDSVEGPTQSKTTADVDNIVVAKEPSPLSSVGKDAANVEIHAAAIKATLDDAIVKVSNNKKPFSFNSDIADPAKSQRDTDAILSKPQATASSASSSVKIISPPRLRIQSEPRRMNGIDKVDYLPKDFSPHSRSSRSNARRRQNGDKDTVTASEGEFSDGVTLDLSIADVSQLTNPTYLEGKVDDESTADDTSTSAKTVEIDLEAKRSEASSSQQTEAATPLICSTTKKLSDDMSLESRNQMSTMWETSALLGHCTTSNDISSGEGPQESDKKKENGWDPGQVEATFPLKYFTKEDDFFGLENDITQKWKPFENETFWSSNPLPSDVDGSADKRDGFLAASSIGQSHDPAELRFEHQPNTSIHVAEVPAKVSPTSSTAINHLGCSPSKSPRSQKYSHARQYAKSMLAARSPQREGSEALRTAPRSHGKAFLNMDTPKSFHSRSTSATSPSSTPPRNFDPGFRPVTPTSRSVTPNSGSVTPKSSSRAIFSSRPITPNQRAITPTINNLRNKGSHGTASKVSQGYQEVDCGQIPAFPTAGKQLDDDPWLLKRSKLASSPRSADEFKQADDIWDSDPFSDPALHLFASDEFSVPLAEESKTLFLSSTEDDFFGRQPPARVSQSSMFSRTHPGSHDYIRQRKHSNAAHVQSFRKKATPPNHVSRHSFNYSTTTTTTTAETAGDQVHSESQPNGRLASVVCKHAALMARLRVLKAARIKRLSDSPPNTRYQRHGASSSTPAATASKNSIGQSCSISSSSCSNRPKTSIGRAIASAYKSRRSDNKNNNYNSSSNNNSANSAVHAQCNCRINTNTAVSEFESFNSALFFPQGEDQCNISATSDHAADDVDDDDDESSTNFGGEAFVATLELD